MSLLLEVIVQSVADAVGAEAGGADRLEVVREIERDGLSPPLDMVRSIASATRLPLRVMVRESDGFGVSGPGELANLKQYFAALAELGVDGAVLGFARDGLLDLDTTRLVLSAAPSLKATFHRAFDTLADPLGAVDALAAVPQIDRILTSGGTDDWAARCARLHRYQGRAGSRLTILAGGGVDEEALRLIASMRCVGEAHVGRAACDPRDRGAPVSAERVRHLKSIAAGVQLR
ncbi:MAG: copper homeostasis protein CutC, partial [Burkholderiales bacterium]